MNHCSEVSHFSYKNTVLLIQLKKFKWLLLQEKFTASPGTMKLGPPPAPHHWLPKDFVPVSICYLGTGFLGTDTPLHHTPKTTARLLCFQCKPLINSSNFSIFYAGLDVGRGHELALGPSWATTAGGSIMGPTSSERSLARACKAPSHRRPPLEAAGRVSAGDVFSHKCKERSAFPNNQGGANLGIESSCITSPAVGPTVSARRHLTLCRGSGGGGQKAVTGGAARRYLNYRLSQNGNWDQPNALPGGKRSSLYETLKSLQEEKSFILAHTFSLGGSGRDGGLGYDGF